MTPLEPAVDRLENAAALDPPAKAIGKGVRSVLSTGSVKDAISGTWLGHALHPMLTDVVIGSFLSATALDLIGGDESDRASRRLLGLGLAAYGPTALTGVNDWADTEPADDAVRRVGLLHAGTNAVALTLFSGSLAARRHGRQGRGKLLSLAGSAVLGAAGYLGGHLSLTRGVGVDQVVFDAGPTEWTDAAAADDLAGTAPLRAIAGDTPVLLVRQGGALLAIHDRCSHRGCSLSDGEIADGVVTCACHGSRFGLLDGALRRGPATAPQPAFETREQEGRIEVRLQAAGAD